MRSWLVIFSIIYVAGVAFACHPLQMVDGGQYETLDVAAKPSTPEAENVIKVFLATLRSGDYAKLNDVLRQMKAVYAKTGEDRELGKYIAYAHLWRTFEHKRQSYDPLYVDDLLISWKHLSFQRGSRHLTARTLGWFGSSVFEVGNYYKDPAMIDEGLRILIDEIHIERDFNNFSAIYALSRMPRESKGFKAAIEMAWAKLDACAGETVNREHPNFKPYVAQQTAEGPERVCWDNASAPHNYSGTFLFFGDLFAKAGDQKLAEVLYKNATLVATFTSWPYKDVLAKRIATLPDSVKVHASGGTPEFLPDSAIACVVCHQN